MCPFSLPGGTQLFLPCRNMYCQRMYCMLHAISQISNLYQIYRPVATASIPSSLSTKHVHRVHVHSLHVPQETLVHEESSAVGGGEPFARSQPERWNRWRRKNPITRAPDCVVSKNSPLEAKGRP